MPDNQDWHQYSSQYYTECGEFKEFIATKGKQLGVSLRRCKEIASLKGNETVLDIGCGRGELAYHCVLDGCKVIALDFSEEALRIAQTIFSNLPKKNIHRYLLLRMDARKLGFQKNSFDVIFMTDIVEHIYQNELESLFYYVVKCLKPGGRIIIRTAPNKNLSYFPLFRPIHDIIRYKKFRKGKYDHLHVNIQSPKMIKNLLNKFGLKSKVWCELTDIKNRYKFLKYIEKALPLNLIATIFAVGTKAKNI